jgi:hypothetical protein
MIAVAIEVPPLHFTAKFANQWKLYSRVRVGDSRERSTIFSSRIHRSDNEQKSQIPTRARDFQCPRPPGLFILLAILLRILVRIRVGLVGLDLRL